MVVWRRCILSALCGGSLLFSSLTSAETLHQLLNKTLQDHALVQLAGSEVSAVEAQLKAEKSAWLPKLYVQGKQGYEDVDRAPGNDTGLETTEAVVGVSQKVWDFGATNRAIDRADLELKNKQLELELQRQNLILAGVEAYIKLRKAYDVLEHAKRSENNIKQQTQLESARIDAGRGYTTDLLQAKAQLLGAQARRVAAEGALEEATHRFVAVFGQPVAPETLSYPAFPNDALPASSEAILAALPTSNPDVLPAQTQAAAARAQADYVKASEWYPTIDLVAESRHLNDVSGIEERRNENAIWMQVNWSFDTGMRQSHAVRAANFEARSKEQSADYVLLQSVEEARNAWNELQTAQARQAYLADQVDISGQFLQLSRKERELGRRSLLDVLNGETTLINAQSELAAVEADTLIAAYRVLRTLGKLELPLFAGGAANSAP